VSKYFSEIFKKLAPEGHAVLVMKKGDHDQGVSQYYMSTLIYVNLLQRCVKQQILTGPEMMFWFVLCLL